MGMSRVSDLAVLPSLKDYDLRCKKHLDQRMLYTGYPRSRFCPICRGQHIVQKLIEFGLTLDQQAKVIELIELSYE